MAKRRSRFSFARFSCFGGQARAKKMAEEGYPVKLHIYDLGQGMARELSATILGKAIEAIWHTGVVVYGREYYFGGGIQYGQPGQTPYGTPVRVEDLGVTHVPREVFEDFLREIGPRYTPATYSLLTHNCNNFSNEAAQFLSGAKVPSYILELPNQVMNSPVGALILPMIQGLETSLRAGAVPQPPQIRPAPAPVTTATTTRAPADDVEQGPTAADDKPEDGKTTGNDDGDGRPAVPPAVEPAAPPAAAVQVRAAVVETKAAPPDPLAEATGAVPQPPQIRPAPAPVATATTTRASAEDVEQGPTAADDKPEDGKTAGNGGGDVSTAVPPAVEPAAPPAAAVQAHAAPAAVVETKTAPLDPLAEATGAMPQPPQIRLVPAPVATATMARPSVDDVEQGSTAAADKPDEEDGKTASSGSDNSSTAVPPAVEPAAPPAAAVQAHAAPAAVVETKTAPLDPLAEATGAMPQPPQIRLVPAPVATATMARPSVDDVEQGSTAAADKPDEEDGKTASSGSDNSSTAVPPAVEPAAPPAAAVQAHAAPAAVVETKTAPLDPLAEATGAMPQPPQIRLVPAPVATATMARPSVDDVEQGSTAAADKPDEEDGKTASSGSDNSSTAVPPAVEPAAAAQVSAAAVEAKAAPPDPLAEAKSRVHEEVKREFAAIMAAGTARPGEAAALAMRRVRERHGRQRAAAVVAQRG